MRMAGRRRRIRRIKALAVSKTLVGSFKEVAQSATQEDGDPNLVPVEFTVVQHMMPLTPSCEIPGTHVRWVMVAMASG